MKTYLDILKRVIDRGEKKPSRTGIDTLTIPPTDFYHDMEEGFPLLTTKKVNLATVASELQWFLEGRTDKRWLQERKNPIWNEWASPAVVPYVELDTRSRGLILEHTGKECIENPDILKLHERLQQEPEYRIPGATESEMRRVSEIAANRRALYDERDLGPVYGFQWRHLGAEYEGPEADHTGKGKDQLEKRILEPLRKNPNDRRMLVSAWNPLDEDKMALPPCHYSWQVNVVGGRLNLTWTQRSVDTPLGLPFNIASYGLLLHLLAKETGYKPGILHGSLHDVHIYENQKEGIEKQLSREPKDLPELVLEDFEGIKNWQYETATTKGYKPEPFIRMPIAV